jgi:predicted DNA-binding transcriptional regulator YafY
VPRNAEVIRQWTILREIERARGAGVTIDQLASLGGVTTRTIRRDLHALEEAGFPLFDDRSHDDGHTRWAINGQAFRGVAPGLTLSELCALYFSRTLLEALSGTPFRDEVESARPAHAPVPRSAAPGHGVEAGPDAQARRSAAAAGGRPPP